MWFDFEFSKCREALLSKQKDIKREGRVTNPISKNEINKRYEQGLLGYMTPKLLLNTLLINSTIYFAMRGGGTEHRDLCWGILLKQNENLHKVYLVRIKRQTKTRTGADITNIPKMYKISDNKDRCPVTTNKVFADKRPQPGYPFLLSTVNHVHDPLDKVSLFIRMSVGRNTLNC